jgi:hypothetical protein
MATDLLVYLLLGVIQVCTAVWGGIVSARSIPDGRERNNHIVAFVFLGLIGLAITVWSGLRSYDSQQASNAAQAALRGEVSNAGRRLEQSLQRQEYMRGQLDSIGLMVGKLGQRTNDPALNTVAEAVKRMADVTNQPPRAKLFPRRHLRLDQAESLSGSLSRMSFLHAAKVFASIDDSDAWDLRADYIKVFRDAHWKVTEQQVSPGHCGAGISLILAHPDDWKTSFAAELDAAFARAQIRVLGRGNGSGIPDAQVNLCIGYNDGD